MDPGYITVSLEEMRHLLGGVQNLNRRLAAVEESMLKTMSHLRKMNETQSAISLIMLGHRVIFQQASMSIDEESLDT